MIAINVSNDTNPARAVSPAIWAINIGPPKSLIDASPEINNLTDKTTNPSAPIVELAPILVASKNPIGL